MLMQRQPQRMLDRFTECPAASRHGFPNPDIQSDQTGRNPNRPSIGFTKEYANPGSNCFQQPAQKDMKQANVPCVMTRPTCTTRRGLSHGVSLASRRKKIDGACFRHTHHGTARLAVTGLPVGTLQHSLPVREPQCRQSDLTGVQAFCNQSVRP